MTQFVTRLENHKGERLSLELVFKDDGKPSEDFVHLSQHRDGNTGPQLEILKIPRKDFRDFMNGLLAMADELNF